MIGRQTNMTARSELLFMVYMTGNNARVEKEKTL